MKPKFVLVTNDYDWEGVYKGGQLAEEDHSIRTHHLVPLLRDGYSSWKEYTIMGDWLEYEGSLPESIEELCRKEGVSEI